MNKLIAGLSRAGVKIIFFLRIFLLAAALPAGAQAGPLLYTNGSGNGNIGGYCASCGPAGLYTMMDDFTLASSQLHLSVEWDASWYDVVPLAAATSDIIISIWANKNADLLWTNTFDFQQLNLVSINTVAGSNANLTMQALLTGVNLSAGNYWLSFSGDDHHFSSSIPGTGALQVSSIGLGLGYTLFSNLPMTFRLYEAPPSEVPEPPTILLFILALAILWLSHRRPRRTCLETTLV